MRILVTGAGGQLGAALARALDAHDAVLLDRAALDVTDADACARALDGADAIIHAAAWTDVEGCESDPDRAMLVNATGTENVARAAGDALVVLVSSDYVFDGTATAPYPETATPAPLQAYGRSKVAAEEAVRRAARWVVARSAWVYGARRADGSPSRNFVAAILAAGTRGSVDVVADQVGSPTAAPDLARALVLVAERGASGVLHVVNEGSASRADLARAVLEEAGLDPARVREIHTPSTAARARRPAYAPLASPGWLAAGFEPLAPWRDALRRTLPSMLEAA